MAVLMLHGKLSGHFCRKENRRTVDAVVAEQIPVRNLFFDANHLSGKFTPRLHQFPGSAAKRTLFLLHSLDLFFQLVRSPVIIGIQKGHVGSPGLFHCPVATFCRSQLLFISLISDLRIFLKPLQDCINFIRGAIIHQQNFHRYLLRERRFQCSG